MMMMALVTVIMAVQSCTHIQRVMGRSRHAACSGKQTITRHESCCTEQECKQPFVHIVALHCTRSRCRDGLRKSCPPSPTAHSAPGRRLQGR